MNFKYRFLGLALANSLLVVGIVLLFSQNADAFSQRLGDLNLANPNDLRSFLIFIGGLLVGFVVNMVFLAPRRHEYSDDQVKTFVHALQGH